MKKEFKVGDRVAVYWYDGRFTGSILLLSKEGSTGYRYFVRFNTGVDKWAHHKQCRRLVKKKRREFDLHFNHGDCEVRLASDKAWIGNTEVIRVREVRK
jgi:hypothetical protein